MTRPTPAGLEGRVVFHAFYSYIKLTPPWNYLVVTAVMVCLAVAGLMAASGGLQAPALATLMGIAFMVCTAAGKQHA